MSFTIRAAAGVAALASTLTFAAAATPASASTNDPKLHAIAESPYQAACSYSANIDWDRATDYLSGNVSVTNHLWFAACRKVVRISLVDDEGKTMSVDIPIDTACATTDPTCPSRIDHAIGIFGAAGHHEQAWIDHMVVTVADR